MAKRDSFLLRIDPAVLASLRQWSEDDMRSLNGQIEFLLREALRNHGRLRDSRATSVEQQTSPPAPRPADDNCSK
ncbi:MAG: PTS ascorbate transporter subunit IIC [Planctomycetales bacterium]|nr:PTS ascorbate transporter subunit IIC [Planctomycetales bacterium]